MSDTTRPVLFLDTTGQGFSRNLAALRDGLLSAHQGLAMRYFFADLESASATAEVDLSETRTLLAQVSSEAGWVITASESKHSRGGGAPKDQRRVHLLSPRLTLAEADGRAGKPMNDYTDVVVPGSAFVPHAQKRFPHAQVHAVGLPVFAELASDTLREQARHQLATLCPASTGKRIVVLTTQRAPENVFGATTVRALAATLPEDAFLVLDIPGMLPALESEPASLADRVFVNDGALRLFSLLALADILLTSKFRDAVYFAVTGRNLFLLNTEANVETLGGKLPVDYEPLGIVDVSALPDALSAAYDEAARLHFQSAYAVLDPETSVTRVVDALF